MILRTSTVISASLSFRVTGVKTCIEKVKQTAIQTKGKKRKRPKQRTLTKKGLDWMSEQLPEGFDEVKESV